MTPLSCKKFTELSSLAMEKPLTLRQKLAYHFHFCICHTCRRFERQINMIDRVLRLAANKQVENPDTENDSPEILSEAAKSRIKEQLKQT